MTCTIRSLCSGFGGLDLAVEQVTGGTVVDHAEVDAHAARIHEAHWPGIPNLGDITIVDWAALEPTDVLCAGYPCQPFSTAGYRRGASDARHLWPHVAEAIRILRPGLVLLENVRGHLSLGFGTVLGDLAAAGYDTEWVCVRASDVGACHRRERVFVAAHPSGAGAGRDARAVPRALEGARRAGAGVHAAVDARAVAADPDITVGRQAGIPERGDGPPAHGGRGAPQPGGCRGAPADPDEWGKYAAAVRRWERTLGRPAPPPTDERGRLSPVFVEWMQGLPDGWVTDVPGVPRTAQLKALGNGVVPAQAVHAYGLLLDQRVAA